MRRLVILLAAALAGCSVELEGAACDEAGTTDQCPTGQACGIDHRCSSKPKLDCDPPGAELAVDVARPTVQGVTPTGAADPPVCRFGSLDDALAAVVTGTTGIKIYKGTGPTIITLSEPLTLRAGLTLAGAEPVPANVVLRATSAMASVVDLAPGAALKYVTVESSEDHDADGITVACGTQTAKATLTNVKVNGANKLRRGLTVTGKCGVEATDLVVTGAKQDGLYIDADASENVTTTITRGELAGNGGSGLVVWAGKVVAQGDGSAKLDVHGNTQYGAYLSARAGATVPSDLTLRLANVHDNAEIGVFLMDAKRPTNSSLVTLDQVSIYKNLASTSLSAYGGRKAGGVLLQGELAPVFSMKGSTVCANGSDEVGVYSDAAWSLSSDSCGATSNSFFVPGGATDYFVFSTASGTNVTAHNNYWGANPPSSRLQGVAYNSIVCLPTPTAPAYCN